MSQLPDITPVIADVMALLQKDLRAELAAQGHVLTGRLSESLQYEIDDIPGGVSAKMFFEDYGVNIEFGVKPERIPYTIGGPRRGGTSLYIQGLISFWQKRGLSGRQAIGAAFATATKHKREGMPTRASYAHSKTGARTGFVKTVLDRDFKQISEIIETKYGHLLELSFAQNIAEGEIKVRA